MISLLLWLLLWILVIGLILYAIRWALSLWGVSEPIRTTIVLILGLICLIALLTQSGLLVGPPHYPLRP